MEDERRLYVLREKQQEHERELCKEKLEAELLVAEKKLDMEKTAVSSTTKLRKLKITPFKGTVMISLCYFFASYVSRDTILCNPDLVVQCGLLDDPRLKAC